MLPTVYMLNIVTVRMIVAFFFVGKPFDEFLQSFSKLPFVANGKTLDRTKYYS